MLIRTEIPSDITQIDALLKNAFDTDAESNLTAKLRENGKVVFSAVACNDENEVVGHSLFSSVTIDGIDDNFLALAPLAVSKDYRKQGIAKELLSFSLESLAELGYKAAFTLGEPTIYHNSGFMTAINFHCKWPVPHEYFMVRELTPNALQGKAGLIEYQPEFDVF